MIPFRSFLSAFWEYTDSGEYSAGSEFSIWLVPLPNLILPEFPESANSSSNQWGTVYSWPWEYLQKDYKHLIRLQNCFRALVILTKGQQIIHWASELLLGLGNIYKKAINIL